MIYDSEIARFLSPDPIIQSPYNLLNYNRYSYCLNNPLKYTDPSGYNRERILRDMEENAKNDYPIKNVIKFKRTYHYFYKLYYRCNDASEKKVVFFISPNPSFIKSKKVKEVLDYASK